MYTFVSIDATNPETLKGLCGGADVCITTMGLTGASTRFTAYDIDYRGNMNLYAECRRAGMKKFNYHLEKKRKESPMNHSKIHRTFRQEREERSCTIFQSPWRC